MRLEFLLSNKKKETKLKGINDADISVSIIKLSAGEHAIIRFETKNSSIECARKLDQVYSQAINNGLTKPLLDERSQFFHNKLFPLINQFECRIRKLLILAGIQNKKTINNKQYKELQKLESYDLSMMYNLLFTDQNYNKQIREMFSINNNYHFTKKEVEEKVTNIKEFPLWDELFVKGVLSDLRESFNSLKDYRNVVMHARTMNYDDYKKAKTLFEKTNSDLESEIIKMGYDQINHMHEIGDSVTPFVLPDYTENLVSAIKHIDFGIKTPMSVFQQFNFNTGAYYSAVKLFQDELDPLSSSVKQLSDQIDSHLSATRQLSDFFKKNYDDSLKPALQIIEKQASAVNEVAESMKKISTSFEDPWSNNQEK